MAIRSTLLAATAVAVLFAGTNFVEAQGGGGGGPGGAGGAGAGAGATGGGGGGGRGGAEQSAPGARQGQSGRDAVGQGSGAERRGQADQTPAAQDRRSGASSSEQRGNRAADQGKENAGKAGRAEPTGERVRKGAQDTGRSGDGGKPSAASESSKPNADRGRKAADTPRSGSSSSETTGQTSPSGGTSTRERQPPGGMQSGAPQRDDTRSRTDSRDAPSQGVGSESQGRAASSGQAQGVTLSSEQQRRIQQTVVSQRNAPRVDRVDFSVRVGTAIPSSVRLATVPPAFVEIYPQWRGASYVLVQDEVVIVDSDREIVAVVPTGDSSVRGSSSRRGSSGRPGMGAGEFADLSPDQIREIQMVLIQRGLLQGEADGIFGARTRQALVAFQRREGLEATGTIDMRTVQSMQLESRIGRSGGQSTPTTDQPMNDARGRNDDLPGAAGRGGVDETTGSGRRPDVSPSPSPPPGEQDMPRQDMPRSGPSNRQ